METQVQGPQQRKNVHQDEQNHGGHDKCHLQLVITHPARRSMWVVGLHIFLAIGCRWNGYQVVRYAHFRLSETVGYKRVLLDETLFTDC